MKSKNQNLFANPDKSGQVVRRIVAFGVVCMLLFAVVSCEGAKEPTVIGGNVCPCDKEMVLWEKQHFPRGEVWLFRNYIPRDFFGLEDTDAKLGAFIFYSSVTGRANLHFYDSYMGLGQGFICNFPDFAKEWLHHENGLRVYIEGVMYYYDFPVFGMTTSFGYQLTSLKRK